LLQAHKWEKHMQQDVDDTDPAKLEAASKAELTKYFASLPKNGTYMYLIFI
jgi:hypothetical protein